MTTWIRSPKIYIDLLWSNFVVEVTNNAQEITERCLRFKPDLLILNNELPHFDADEICATVKTELKLPVILLIDKNSGKTSKIDGCFADEVYENRLI